MILKILNIYILFFAFNLNAQITLIPDSGFELYLIFLDIDSDGEINGQVLTSDVENVTTLFLHDFNHTIFDLTGIEDFTALTTLEVWQQDFTTINLTNNLNLTFLSLNTPLESIDVSNNTNLIELRLSTISNLNELDLSTNINLETLHLSNALLTALDLSQNINFYKILLYGNHDLQYINLQNGTNEGVLIIVEINFSNENIICIQVDDPVAVMAGDPPYQFWDIDESISISDNCEFFSLEDPALPNLIKMYPNPVSNYLLIENNSNVSINRVQVFNALGSLVLEVGNPDPTIDVSGLAAGLLLVKVITDNGVLTHKIVKQ